MPDSLPENLPESLKAFYQRALQAEERLARVEAALATKKDTGNAELLEKISELQSKLADTNAKLEREQKRNSELQSNLEDANAKVKGLTIENAKQKYRTKHLVQALKAADEKIELTQGNSDERIE